MPMTWSTMHKRAMVDGIQMMNKWNEMYWIIFIDGKNINLR